MSSFRTRLGAAVQAFLHPEPMDLPIREPKPPPPPSQGKRTEAPPGAKNVVVVVLDSCRYDHFAAHVPRALRRFGAPQRRFSYASWTAPSHYNLLMGLLPHSNTPGTHASAVYEQEYARWGERLSVPIRFEQMLPSLWFPRLLREGLGYRTVARVSLPVLNPGTAIARDFDEYLLMPRHNDLDGMIESLRFYADQPSFVLLNAGETHYPYAMKDDPRDLPTLHGLHGVVKHADARLRDGQGVTVSDAPDFFDERRLLELKQRQIDVLQRLDRSFERLLDVVPNDTWIIVTSDHGELFGEAGCFGHGPFVHDKLWEVPLIEGRRS